MSFLEIVAGYVGAAATKALLIEIVILATSTLFVDLKIQGSVAKFECVLHCASVVR